MSITVLDPIGRAWTRMTRVLFQPFGFRKWLALGFMMFLMEIGRGGGLNVHVPFVPSGWMSGGIGTPDAPRKSPQQIIDELAQYLQQNLVTILLIVLAVLIAVAVVSTLLIWLQCRARFVLFDDIVNNRGTIARPWKEYRAEGNSLFVAKLWVYSVVSLLGLAAVAVGVLVAWGDIAARHLTGLSLTAMALTSLLMGLTGLLLLLAGSMLDQIIAPVMFTRRLRTRSAWRVVRTEILPGHVTTVLLFFLMRLVLAFAASTVTMVAGCATCCLAFVPVVGTLIMSYAAAVLTLPLSILLTAYSMYFVQQFGPNMLIFRMNPDDPRCPACNYDLRGNPTATQCPECGQSLSTGQPASLSNPS
ncbi:MAG: hypothetical protein IT440_01345 [Phycisphaeraceae bacterium]|nr:hypothetical protein [Phycisphaeraceae bacterium]